jgi:hypothetical protein
VSERVCHTMLGMREASSFVPEIGTADTSDKRRSTECSHNVARAKNGSDLRSPCAGRFGSLPLAPTGGDRWFTR